MRGRSTERTLGLTGLLLLAAYALVAVAAARWLLRCDATCAEAGGRTAGVALVALSPLALAGFVLCARAAVGALPPSAARAVVALSRGGLCAGALALAVIGFLAVRQTAPVAGAGACLLAWVAVRAAWRLP
jgi:hypothetical protein